MRPTFLNRRPPPAGPPGRAAHPTFTRRARGRTGFTLVEILTATAIMAGLVALVLTILSQVMDTWNRQSEELTMGHQAQTAMNIIQRDLQGLILKRDGSQWLALYDKDRVQDQDQSRLVFFATTPMHETKNPKDSTPIYGDICAIEYRLVYANPFDATDGDRSKSIFSLHRSVINPQSTMKGWDQNTPLMGSNDLFTSWEKIDTTGDNSEVIDSIKVYGGNKSKSSLADNVAKFEVKLYYYYQNPSTPNNPVQVLPSATVQGSVPSANPSGTEPLKAAYFGGTSKLVTTGGQTGGSFGGNLTASTVSGFSGLAYADVTLIILNEEGATLYAEGNLQGLTVPKFLERHGKTYTQRVHFPNRLQ